MTRPQPAARRCPTHRFSGGKHDRLNNGVHSARCWRVGGARLDEQTLVILREQVPGIILGTVFLVIGLAACGAAAIRGGGRVRLLVWLCRQAGGKTCHTSYQQYGDIILVKFRIYQ